MSKRIYDRIRIIDLRPIPCSHYFLPAKFQGGNACSSWLYNILFGTFTKFPVRSTKLRVYFCKRLTTLCKAPVIPPEFQKRILKSSAWFPDKIPRLSSINLCFYLEDLRIISHPLGYNPSFKRNVLYPVCITIINIYKFSCEQVYPCSSWRTLRNDILSFHFTVRGIRL